MTFAEDMVPPAETFPESVSDNVLAQLSEKEPGKLPGKLPGKRGEKRQARRFGKSYRALAETEADINPVDVRFAAMNYLARREHSREELRRKLSQRFGDFSVIDEAVQRLAEENLQSDDRFAASYLRQRSGRGFGPLRIRQEMRERGLSDAQIGAAFAQEEPNWFELAEQAYIKKYGGSQANPLALDIKERSRRTRFFQYRGFAGDHYRHLLGEI